MATVPVQPSQGSQTITVTPGSQPQSQALHVVQIGNITQFSHTPQPPQPAAFGGTANTLGQGVAQNPVLAQAQRDREARRQAQMQVAQPQPNPIPQAPPPPQPLVSGNMASGSQYRTASGSPDPGPSGLGGSQAPAWQIDAEIRRLLEELTRQRKLFLKELFSLCEIWKTVPLNCLDGLFVKMIALQSCMQTIELGTAQQILTAGGGPPGDPSPGGSTVTSEEDRARLTLRLQNRSRQRFNAALVAMTLQQQILVNGQQMRAQRRQNFNQALQALTNNPPPAQPTQGWQNMVQANQNFANAQQALALAPPPILPTMNWQQVVAQHQNFLLAQQALINNPPPAQPTQGWQNMVQAHQNFGQAQQALMNNPPPAQPTQGHQNMVQANQNFVQAQQALMNNPPPIQPTQAWHNMVQQHTNFQNALNNLTLNPPLPLLQGAIANNANHAPMAYAIPFNQAQHILHGNHGGGQHMGHYNPALHGAAPNVVTHHNFPGHFVSYFPVAWDAQDILSAIAEAAQASYHLAWQQANGNWQHPPVWVTRRGITIQIVAITSVNFHGNLIVWTAWAV